MESIFTSKKDAKKSQAKQSSLLANEAFKKTDQQNPFTTASEESKQTENVVFKSKEVIEDADMQEDDTHPEKAIYRPESSFEITSAFKLAYKQDPRLSLGCKILNDFMR
jgi:hypothetical protein